MSNATSGSLIGTMLGDVLPGPEGVVTGGMARSFLGKLLPGPADVLSDLLGEVGLEGLKGAARLARDRVTLEAQTEYQSALHGAFHAAVVDIGVRRVW
jgi:hypothetical protein